MFETTKKKVADWYGVQRLRFRYYISSFLIGSGIVYCVVGAILLFSTPFYSYWLLIPAAISIGIGLALWKYRTEGARKALICWVVLFCLALFVLLVCLISEGRRASEYFQVLGSFFVLAGPAFVAVTHVSVLFGKGAPTHAEVRVNYLNKDLSALTIYRPDPDAEPTCECKFFKAVGKVVGYIIGCIVCLCLICVVVGLILDRQTDTGSHQPSEIAHETSNAITDGPSTEEMQWKKRQSADALVDLILTVADHFLSDGGGGETVIPAKLVLPE